MHLVYFDRITGSAIRDAALRTRGAAGPSGVDATGWRCLCTSFHKESADHCDAVAACARRMCAEVVDPEGLRYYTASRLFPIDKSPGVQPIGISEVIRRIVGKAIMPVINDDVLAASGHYNSVEAIKQVMNPWFTRCVLSLMIRIQTRLFLLMQRMRLTI